MKDVSGAGFYVKMMERFMDKGIDQLKKDMALMKAMMDTRKASWPTLDEMKRRYNIVNSLVPTPIPPPPEERKEAGPPPPPPEDRKEGGPVPPRPEL
jgi:hypothetical protein